MNAIAYDQSAGRIERRLIAIDSQGIAARRASAVLPGIRVLARFAVLPFAVLGGPRLVDSLDDGLNRDLGLMAEAHAPPRRPSESLWPDEFIAACMAQYNKASP